MYTHHIFTIYAPNTPLKHPLNTLNTPHIHHYIVYRYIWRSVCWRLLPRGVKGMYVEEDPSVNPSCYTLYIHPYTHLYYHTNTDVHPLYTHTPYIYRTHTSKHPIYTLHYTPKYTTTPLHHYHHYMIGTMQHRCPPYLRGMG